MWEKITVGKFQQMHDVMAGQFENEYEKRLHVLAVLEGKEPSYYEDLPASNFLKELEKLRFLSVGDIPSIPAPREITIESVKYRVLYDFRDLTAGQFIDAMDATKHADQHILNLHRILACICVPEGKKYMEVPFDQVADAMLSVSILHAQAIALFFYQVWSAFLNSMPAFLAKTLKKSSKEKRQRLEQALLLFGVGSNLQPR